MSRIETGVDLARISDILFFIIEIVHKDKVAGMTLIITLSFATRVRAVLIAELVRPQPHTRHFVEHATILLNGLRIEAFHDIWAVVSLLFAPSVFLGQHVPVTVVDGECLALKEAGLVN